MKILEGKRIHPYPAWLPWHKRLDRFGQPLPPRPAHPEIPLFWMTEHRGDIHGHAAPLKALLAKLGYGEQQGVWRHPQRKVIFLGDFIDRGPEQVACNQIVSPMLIVSF